MDTWVQVEKLEDGDSANAETLNTPIDQLAARTEYLKRRLGSIVSSGIQSSLILRDVDLAKDEVEDMKIGNVVYIDDAENSIFRRAQAKMHLYDNLWETGKSAFTVGILVDIRSEKGDVLIYGKMDIGADTRMLASNMLQSGEKFQPGRYYLSATEPGRITSKPGGPVIYIGSFHSAITVNGEFSSDAMACINPQFMDIGTSHVHRAYRLVARPAGAIVDGKLVGHLPESHDRPGKEYPSLVFGGTWMERYGVDTEYHFFLSSSNSWGEVTLSWTKGGSTAVCGPVDIPAPGTFVDLDNGLKVKVLFPEATADHAFVDLSDDERKWTMTFPHAGKGWVVHSVEAVAEDTSGGGPAGEPAAHVLFYGSWPQHDNTVACSLPEQAFEADLGTNVSLLGHVEIDGAQYQFVSVGEDPDDGYVPVTRAATVSESLANLAKVANSDMPGAVVLYSGSTLVTISAEKPLIDNKEQDQIIKYAGEDFDVVGGTAKLMAVYDSAYKLLGDGLIHNAPAYVPVRLGGLYAEVYATDATSAIKCTCRTGTVFMASAYDYAPAAVYDYAMGLHQSVDYYFPPVPAQAAGLFVNGVKMENAALYPDNPTYVVGRKTIHWMEDDNAHLPWPVGATDRDSKMDPSDDKTIDFHFVVGFQCATGPVTSIIPAPESSIKIYTYGTNEEAYTGDLMIDASLDFHVEEAGVRGFNVAKKGLGGKLLAGPVVEKVKGGAGIVVTQEAGCPVGQGTVTIGLANGTLKDHFNEIALENAKQEKLGLFPYVSLLGMGEGYGSIPSAFTIMMRVPTDLDETTNYRLNLRATMFGAAGYTDMYQHVAGLMLEYNILPDFTGDVHDSLKTGLIEPPSPRHLKVPLGHYTGTEWKYVGYDPFVATTENDAVAPKSSDVCVTLSDLPMPSEEELGDVKLKPGYLVAIRISRERPAGIGGTSGLREYSAPLGFLSLEWTLEEA